MRERGWTSGNMESRGLDTTSGTTAVPERETRQPSVSPIILIEGAATRQQRNLYTICRVISGQLDNTLRLRRPSSRGGVEVIDETPGGWADHEKYQGRLQVCELIVGVSSLGNPTNFGLPSSAGGVS
jgi:hypothetical protein